MPRRFELAQIVVGLAKDADKAAEEAARRKLDDILGKLKQPGADFALVAPRDILIDQPIGAAAGKIVFAIA